MEHTLNTSNWEAEAVGSQLDLQSEFLGSQSYKEKPRLENKQKPWVKSLVLH